jgi:hypothetical protein
LTSEPQDIAKALEALIQEAFPDAVRSVDGSDVGYGFGKGYKGLVFVVSPQKDYVNLGVAQGAALSADFPILQGAGKVHRHVKVHDLADLKNPELRRLMKAALKSARARHKVGD